MTPRDQAFHTLGRAVVNLQRLEFVLKRLSRLGPVEGTLLGVQSQLEARAELSDWHTLGQAINAWLDVLHGRVAKPARHDDLFEVTIRSGISFNFASADSEAHAQGLKALLEERNFIIHGGLAQFPWDSDADCVELSQYLETINRAVAEHFEFLKPICLWLADVSEGQFEVAQGTHPHELVGYLVRGSEG